MGTVVAKKALLGEDIIIVNSDQAVITGNKDRVMKDWKQKADRGTFKGPFIPKRSDLFVKRAIRGMIPYKTPRGKEAFARIKCFVGTPSKVAEEKIETIENANVSRLDNLKYVSVKDICAHLGGKQ